MSWEHRCFVRLREGTHTTATARRAAHVPADVAPELRVDVYFPGDDAELGLKQRGAEAGSLELKTARERKDVGVMLLDKARITRALGGRWTIAESGALAPALAAAVDVAVTRPPLCVTKRRWVGVLMSCAVDVAELEVTGVAPRDARWLTCCAESDDVHKAAKAGAMLLSSLLADPSASPALEARVCSYARWAHELARARDAAAA